MPTILSPAASGEYIVQHAKHLRVLPAGIEKLTQQIIAAIKDQRLDVTNFSQCEWHPRHDDAHAVDWIFLVDTLNFCFWTMGDYTKYKVNNQTGYFALCAAVNRAMSEGVDITNPAYYAKIDRAALEHIFRSDDGLTMVPLLEKRLECMHQVGARLLEKWDGTFANVVRAAGGSAARLLELIVGEFACFRDEAEYAGQRVAIYKRAQILIGDLWVCFRGEGLGAFNDLERITMFADYRVPQVLVHFGSLAYNDEFLELLRADTLLENGDPMEVEIRGASIYIVERVKEALLRELAEKHPEISRAHVNSILIDHFLWDYRRKFAKELEHIPFHKTYSIYY